MASTTTTDAEFMAAVLNATEGDGGDSSFDDLPLAPPPPPAHKPEIKDLSHTHEAIMNFMVANPSAYMRDVAAHFGYTQAWLSTMVHSDCFQARLKEKQDLIFAGIAGGIGEKLSALADIGVEKLLKHTETSEDPRFLMDATKLALSSLGFGQKNTGPAAGPSIGTQNVQQNFYVASPEDLSAARSMMQARAVSPLTVDALPPAGATPVASSGSAEGGLNLVPNCPLE